METQFSPADVEEVETRLRDRIGEEEIRPRRERGELLPQGQAGIGYAEKGPGRIPDEDELTHRRQAVEVVVAGVPPRIMVANDDAAAHRKGRELLLEPVEPPPGPLAGGTHLRQIRPEPEGQEEEIARRGDPDEPGPAAAPGRG